VQDAAANDESEAEGAQRDATEDGQPIRSRAREQQAGGNAGGEPNGPGIGVGVGKLRRQCAERVVQRRDGDDG
jgi:hypothetical protein